MALPDSQDDAMSLTSLREEGLFTGEEITIKFGSGHLTVLVETDENTDEEDSLSPSVVAESSLLTGNPQYPYAGDYEIGSPIQSCLAQSSADPPRRIGTDAPTAHINATEESVDEGVNTILIERHESNHPYNDEAHVGHYIQPLTVAAPQRRPPLSPASNGEKRRFSFKNIQVKMNRLKAVVSRGNSGGATAKTGGTANTCDTHGSNSNHSGKSGVTSPRVAQLVQEASIHFTEGMEQLHQDSLSNIITNPETQLHTIGSIDYDAITKDEYIKMTTPHASNLSSNSSTEQIEEYDIIHTSHVIDPQTILPQPSRDESEQIDPSYTGPYDDNKSLVTYSTGDFDMSQMYSRSWSTIAPTTASVGGAPLITGILPTPKRTCSRSNTSRCSGSSNQNTECGNGVSGKREVVVGPILNVARMQRRGKSKIKEESVSLDGLSLVNSVVGDDRSYVEDY